jgi:hypothetical protein
MANAGMESFSAKVKALAETDSDILGVGIAGSAITNETDAFSDLDLVIVTKFAIAPDREKMRAFAQRFPGLIAEFTGEHVGEKRLLICLYDNPLLHVDFKFLQEHELDNRVENPVILFERNGILTQAFAESKPRWPSPDPQWIEDRFWVWIHYTLLKVGRGELFEALDCLTFLRGQVLGPLLHLKYGRLPRGVRRLEQVLSAEDLAVLQKTVPRHNRREIMEATGTSADLYRKLRRVDKPNAEAERAALTYLEKIGCSKA